MTWTFSADVSREWMRLKNKTGFVQILHGYTAGGGPSEPSEPILKWDNERQQNERENERPTS